MNKAILDKIVEIIDREGDISLATLRPDGFPQINVMSYVNDGMTIYFGTSETSQKVKNISFDERVSVSINVPRKEWTELEGVTLGGVANVIHDPSEHQTVRHLLFSKYPEIAAYAPSTDHEALLYRIDPVVLTLLDYKRGFGFSKTVTVD